MKKFLAGIICLSVFCAHSASFASEKKMLGIGFGKLNAAKIAILGSGTEDDLVISQVFSKSKANGLLEVGDILMSVDSISFKGKNSKELLNYLRSSSRDYFEFRIIRNGKVFDYTVGKYRLETEDEFDVFLAEGYPRISFLSFFVDSSNYFSYINGDKIGNVGEFQDLYYGSLNSERAKEAMETFRSTFKDIDPETCVGANCKVDYFTKAKDFLEKYPDILYFELILYAQARDVDYNSDFLKYILARFMDKKEFNIACKSAVLNEQSIKIIRSDKPLLDKFTKRTLELNDNDMLAILAMIKFGEKDYSESLVLCDKMNFEKMQSSDVNSFMHNVDLLFMKKFCMMYAFDMKGYTERAYHDAKDFSKSYTVLPESQIFSYILKLKIVSKISDRKERVNELAKLIDPISKLYFCSENEIHMELVLKMLIYIHSELNDKQEVNLKKLENPLTKNLGYRDYLEITRILSAKQK